MVTAVAGASGAAEADHDGPLRGRTAPADLATMGARIPGPDPPLGCLELGTEPHRRGFGARNSPVRQSGAVPGTHSRGPRRTIGEERRGGVPLPRVVAKPERFLTHESGQASMSPNRLTAPLCPPSPGAPPPTRCCRGRAPRIHALPVRGHSWM